MEVRVRARGHGSGVRVRVLRRVRVRVRVRVRGMRGLGDAMGLWNCCTAFLEFGATVSARGRAREALWIHRVDITTRVRLWLRRIWHFPSFSLGLGLCVGVGLGLR